jgi:DNA-3-methyladenine glycosylase II
MKMAYSEISKILSKKDPILAKVIKSVKTELERWPSTDIYDYLLETIPYQQLSVESAKKIRERFTSLFGNQYPSAQEILSADKKTLRGTGLSSPKTQYIINVARFSLNNDMSLEHLNTKTDDEVIDYLTQIKGIGEWSAQMVLMFPMDRPNVFPEDDVGIKNKMKGWYDINLEEKELKAKLISIADNWDPYKTLACRYLWKSELEKGK